MQELTFTGTLDMHVVQSVLKELLRYWSKPYSVICMNKMNKNYKNEKVIDIFTISNKGQ